MYQSEKSEGAFLSRVSTIFGFTFSNDDQHCIFPLFVQFLIGKVTFSSLATVMATTNHLGPEICSAAVFQLASQLFCCMFTLSSERQPPVNTNQIIPPTPTHPPASSYSPHKSHSHLPLDMHKDYVLATSSYHPSCSYRPSCSA